MPYGDIGENMNKARVAEAARGLIKMLSPPCLFGEADWQGDPSPRMALRVAQIKNAISEWGRWWI